MEHYLDNAATTAVCPEAAEAALRAMTEVYGNPSSLHSKGMQAENELKKAKKSVAARLRVGDEDYAVQSRQGERLLRDRDRNGHIYRRGAG